MLLKGTKGYFKDKVLKTEKGNSLIRDYDFLLRGCSKIYGINSKNTEYVKEKGKLYELVPSFDYLTKAQLIKKYGIDKANKKLKDAHAYLKPRQFTPKENEQLSQALIRILTSGTYTVYYTPESHGRNDMSIYGDESYIKSPTRRFTFNFSKYFEKIGVSAKSLLNKPSFGRTNHLGVLVDSFSIGRLPFNMWDVVIDELYINCFAKGMAAGRITGVTFDKMTVKIINQLNESLSVYRIKSEEVKKKDLKLDSRVLELLDVKDGIRITGSDIKKFMNKDSELEKIASSVKKGWGVAPKRYRKEIMGGKRTQVRSELGKVINGEKDAENLELGSEPKDAKYDFY